MALQLDQKTVDDILRTVENHHQECIQTGDQTLAVGSYTFAQIWQAIGQQAMVWTGKTIPGAFTGHSETKKPFSGEGNARLLLLFPSPIASFPDSISLTTELSGKYQVNIALPLKEITEKSGSYHFHDFRSNTLQSVLDMQTEGATPQSMARMWLGLRWLCCNLRQWDHPGIVWPEDLDKRSMYDANIS